MLNQNFQEPFVAIVIDPVRTISAGKVCLGAFRTYPKVKFSQKSSTDYSKVYILLILYLIQNLIIYEVEMVFEKKHLIQTYKLQTQ